MAWSVLRKATDEDYWKMEEIEKRFEARFDQPLDTIWFTERSGRYSHPDLRKVGLAAIRRAFGKGVDGIAYGCVGSHVS